MKRGQSWRRCSGNNPRYPISKNLTSLLYNERFLMSIFEHLVDYGLKECRLVCRKWREACKLFPVEIRKIEGDRLRKLWTIPNATSLSVHYRRQTMSDATLFEHLASLTKLRSLVFDGDFIFFGRSAQPYMESITQLTDLTIQYAFSDPTEDSLASLNCLTNLTKLALRNTTWRFGMDPLVGLQNIQELEIEACYLFGEAGACMFPSLTNLTYLKLADNLTEGEAPKRSFEARLQFLALRMLK